MSCRNKLMRITIKYHVEIRDYGFDLQKVYSSSFKLKINLAFGNGQGEDLQIIHQRIHDIVLVLNDFNKKKDEHR